MAEYHLYQCLLPAVEGWLSSTACSPPLPTPTPTQTQTPAALVAATEERRWHQHFPLGAVLHKVKVGRIPWLKHSPTICSTTPLSLASGVAHSRLSRQRQTKKRRGRNKEDTGASRRDCEAEELSDTREAIEGHTRTTSTTFTTTTTEIHTSDGWNRKRKRNRSIHILSSASPSFSSRLSTTTTTTPSSLALRKRGLMKYRRRRSMLQQRLFLQLMYSFFFLKCFPF